MNSTKKRSLKKVIAIALIALALIGAGAFYALYPHKKSAIINTTQNGQKLNLSPPTAADKQEATSNKDSLAKKIDSQTKDGAAPAPTLTANGKTVASIVIASSSSTRIAAYVSNVFEDGGICTMTLTNGTNVITKQTTSFQNASYTQCPPFSITRAEYLVAGTWNLLIHYESKSTAGDSAPATVEVK